MTTFKGRAAKSLTEQELHEAIKEVRQERQDLLKQIRDRIDSKVGKVVRWSHPALFSGVCRPLYDKETEKMFAKVWRLVRRRGQLIMELDSRAPPLSLTRRTLRPRETRNA